MAESNEESKQLAGKNKLFSWYGVRHTQMLMMFSVILIGYGMRVNLSVGIVAMTDPTANPDYDFPVYNWTDNSVILSSFFWGYVIPQIGIGQLAERYGIRWFLTGAMTISAAFTVLIPFMAELGSWGVMICRVFQGFTQGFFYPCMHICLSKWIPLSERSRMGTFIYTGGPFGTVLTMPITGWISGSAIGWPSVFYMYGALGFAWVAVWLWLGANGPSDHKSVSKEEVEYIEKNIGQAKEHVPTPWKHVAKSLPAWAILVAHCGQNWGFWTLMTEIPTYMAKVLDYDIKANGLLSAAPYFTLWVLSFFFSYATDLFVNRKILSVGVSRKIMNGIGLIVPALGLIGLGLAGAEDKGLAIGLLIIAVGFNSAVYCGFNINHVDISPTHAGTLMGITNCVSNILGIVAPLLVQFIVTDESDPDQWQIIFFIASAIYVAASIFYSVFASGEVQYWDNIGKKCCSKDEENQAEEMKKL